MQEAWETWVRSLGQEDPLEKGMAAHSRILAWRIPCTEWPSELHNVMASERVGHDWIAIAHRHAASCGKRHHTGYLKQNILHLFIRPTCTALIIVSWKAFCFKYSSVHMSILNFHSISPPSPPLCNSVCFLILEVGFCFVNKFILVNYYWTEVFFFNGFLLFSTE